MSINSGETTDYFVNSCGMQVSQEWKRNVMTVGDFCRKYDERVFRLEKKLWENSGKAQGYDFIPLG